MNVEASIPLFSYLFLNFVGVLAVLYYFLFKIVIIMTYNDEEDGTVMPRFIANRVSIYVT